MDEIHVSVGDAIGAACCSLIVYVANIEWSLVIVWLGVMVLDIVTGTICSIVYNRFSSNQMRVGLFRKLSEIAMVVALIFGNFVLENYVSIHIPTITVFLSAFIFKDIASINETVREMGVDVPQIIGESINKAIEYLNRGDDDEL